MRLYLEGLSTGDFEPIFRALVGETAALSPSSIVRLKDEWAGEFRLWRGRPNRERYVYLLPDRVYLKAGLENENTAGLVVLGVSADGRKELLAMGKGYRESASSWGEMLRDLKARGLTAAPLLAVGDGGLGFWATLGGDLPPDSAPEVLNPTTFCSAFGSGYLSFTGTETSSRSSAAN